MADQTKPAPDRATSPQARAWHYHMVGRHDHAIEAFNEILMKEPDDIDALYGLGLAQKAAGQHDTALKSFRRVMEILEPLNAEVTAELARLRERVEAQTDDVLQLAGAISESEMDALEARVNRVAMLMRMTHQQLESLKAKEAV